MSLHGNDQKADEIGVEVLGTKELSPTTLLEALNPAPFAPDHLKMRTKRLMEEVHEDPNDKELKEDLFSLSTQHLYSSVKINSSNKENIVVTGMVHPDGVGDYYHILSTVETIRKQFPDAKITMLINHTTKFPNSVRKPADPNIEIIFRNFREDQQPIYPVIEKADQIIEMSQHTHFDSVIEDMIKQKGDRYIYIVEYGKSHPESRHSMGLKNRHVGIFIKDMPSTVSMLDIKNEPLKQALFGNNSPSQEDLKNYLQTHEPFIGYLKMGSYYQMGLIYTAAALSKSSGKKVIDLMIPPVKLEYLDLEFLKEQGIGKLKVIKIENGRQIENEIVIAETGKEMRLINPFPLEQSDFHTLLAHTNPLVGCTGDHSLSEAISFDRLPFYELRYAKVGFQADLRELAGSVGIEPHYLKQYFEVLGEIYDYVQERVINTLAVYDKLEDKKFYQEELDYFKGKQTKITESSLKIANLLQHPELYEEMHEFNELVRTQYSFNSTLLDIVQRQLVLNRHPDLIKTENELKEKYLSGQITIDQANEQLSEKIKAVGLR